uniref:Lipoyl synthase, mitochondrial n=2 Tax=Hirondellea gigas TaxID=1518452 RepID=A0A6A7GCI8_9CRUS
MFRRFLCRRSHHSRFLSTSSSPQLRQGPSLDDFINGSVSPSPSTSASSPSPRRKVREKKPPWLRSRMPSGEHYHRLKDTVRSLGLSTVCEEAQCPNIGECWSGGENHTATATIMLMGDTCTRGCRFCAVKTSRTPGPLDPNEPRKVSEAILKWGLDYVVLTSVDRDDIEDGGASHIAETVRLLKNGETPILVEVLTPDFSGKLNDVSTVALSGLEVFAHNIETVESQTRFVRDYRANYHQSLRVLEGAKAAKPSLITKTSIMLGVGETDDEIRQTMRDLRSVGVEVLTFGQYLRPSKRHMKVREYVTPENFDRWKVEGEDLGFVYVASGPLVRSSYKAGEFYLKTILNKRKAEC